ASAGSTASARHRGPAPCLDPRGTAGSTRRRVSRESPGANGRRGRTSPGTPRSDTHRPGRVPARRAGCPQAPPARVRVRRLPRRARYPASYQCARHLQIGLAGRVDAEAAERDIEIDGLPARLERTDADHVHSPVSCALPLLRTSGRDPLAIDPNCMITSLTEIPARAELRSADGDSVGRPAPSRQLVSEIFRNLIHHTGTAGGPVLAVPR